MNSGSCSTSVGGLDPALTLYMESTSCKKELTLTFDLQIQRLQKMTSGQGKIRWVPRRPQTPGLFDHTTHLLLPPPQRSPQRSGHGQGQDRDEEGRVRRTTKLLEAIANGKVWILDGFNWLKVGMNDLWVLGFGVTMNRLNQGKGRLTLRGLNPKH